MTRTPTTIALLAALVIPMAHAETPLPVLHSLPAEVQKNIEQVRTACREYWTGRGFEITPYGPGWVSSGDEGLIPFTVSGAQAVMVSNLNLCGGQCLKGAVCYTTGFYDINIYVRTGQAWRNAFSTKAGGAVFLSTDKATHTKFNALVLSVSGADKNCPVPYWKQFCDVVVKWDGKKFTYMPL